MADAVLVRRACRPDSQGRRAYDQLVRRHESQVRGLLRALCRNPSQADDLAQDAFLRGWQRLAELRDPSSFAAWIKRLAYRMFLHAERRRKVETRYLEGLPPEPVALLQTDDRELNDLLAMCRPHEAELMVLVYGFGFTVAEIARERGLPTGTIKSHLARAKQRIHRSLKPEKLEENHA